MDVGGDLSEEALHAEEGGPRMPEDDDPWIALGRVVEDLGEPVVRGDEAAPLPATGVGEIGIGRSPQGLLRDGRDVVPGVGPPIPARRSRRA